MEHYDHFLGWQLHKWKVELDNRLFLGKLRFRRGWLENQIQDEVKEGDHSLPAAIMVGFIPGSYLWYLL